MLRKLILAAALVVGFSLPVAAERFDLTSQETVYGCSSERAAQALFKASIHDNYGYALGTIVGLEAEVCPEKGPFTDNRMFAEVVDFGRIDAGSYNGIAVVRWQFTNSNRNFYSVLMRSRSGIWSDATDTVMEQRTATGILDFLTR